MTTSTDAQPTPVTRMEILDFVEVAFTGPWVSKAELMAFARDHHARRDLLSTLDRLNPDRRYASPRDLWVDLPDVPVEV